MSFRNVVFFIIVCGIAGLCILLGSVLGNIVVPDRGLFAGAMVGGVVGVAAALPLAACVGALDRASYGAAFLGGVIGFTVAAVIAVNNLRGPVIPLLSTGLIGLGAIIGKALGKKHPA